MATNKKKSWKDKFEAKNDDFQSIKDTKKGKMYISSPIEIDKIIRKVPSGKLITTKIITEVLTKKYKVDYTCPLTTGIFVSIIANKVEEELSQGKSVKDVTPYWRVIKKDGQIYEKYLGKPSKQMQYLKKEGFKFIMPKAKSKQPIVMNFKQYLITTL